jgi:4-amino-4-deoxy-L-arabinose transferase-like glycosyltransferase
MSNQSGPMARRWLLPFALLLITALAAFLRFWQLDRIPPGFHYDEAYEALEAWRVLTQRGYHPIFFPGNFGVEPMFVYLTSLAFRLFGETPTVMRGVAALIGTLTVPALYALGRELMRSDQLMPAALPLFAALALAIMRWHIFFSRVGIEPILVPFLLTLMLWAHWRARRTNSLVAWIAFGLTAGLGPYTYPAGRLLPVIALMLGVGTLVRRIGETGKQGNEETGKRAPIGVTSLLRTSAPLLLSGVVALVVVAPLALNWLQHPDQLLLRSSQIAVGPAGAAGGTPVRNVLATAAMFNFRGDPDPRNNQPGLPVLDILMSIPFLIGLGVTLWRWRRPAFGVILLAGAIMLAPTVLSEYAPHFRRAVGATPIVALLCGLGLAILLGQRRADLTTQPDEVPARLREDGVSPEQIAAGMDRLRRLGRVIIVAVIMLGATVYTMTAYFGKWGNSQAIYYAYDQGLWEIGQYVLGLPADEAVYITPRPATDMTLAFAWREGRPVRHFDGRYVFIAAASDRPTNYIVIEHEDFRGGQLLRSLYPDAVETHTFRDRAGQVYARAYRVPPSSVAARQPMYPAQGRWPSFDLVGFDLDRADASYRPGDIVYLQLWWRATGKSDRNWTVFTHLLGPARPDGNRVWAGRDAQPGQGSVPTTAWAPGDLILDEYQLQLPPDAPPGDYEIEIGLYDPAENGARSITTSPAGLDHLTLGTIKVEQAP